jgi:hypothetical protein
VADAENIGAGEVPVLLDAPVSGGVVGAEAATLTFMVQFLCFILIAFLFCSRELFYHIFALSLSLLQNFSHIALMLSEFAHACILTCLVS